jgi:hypothetical protein
MLDETYRSTIENESSNTLALVVISKNGFSIIRRNSEKPPRFFPRSIADPAGMVSRVKRNSP